MNPFDQSLENSDPEIAALLKQAQQAQQSLICLLPEESFIKPQPHAVSRASFEEEPYGSTVGHVPYLVGFDYADLRLHAKHEAILCICAAATGGNNDAGILYFDLVGFHSKATPSVADFVRRQYRNTEEFVGMNIRPEMIAKDRGSSTELVVVDASMYPKNVNFQSFRELADSIGAHLAVDIGYFAGLAAAKVYEATLQSADFVIADSRGTLGGPPGILLFGREEFRPALTQMIDQYVGEDFDISAVLAKTIAIEQASLEDGISVQAESVENARELLARLRDQGTNLLFDATDTHLVLLDLSTQVEASDAARSLYEIGILASAGVVSTDCGRKSTNVLCFGTSVVTNQRMGMFEMGLLAEVIAGTLLPSSSRDRSELKRVVAHLSVNFK